MKNIILLILITVLLSACNIIQISSTDITSDFYPPKQSPAEVAYVESPQKAHEVIGYVTINAERVQDFNVVLKKMKYEAAILGGDAITDIRTNAGRGKWAKFKPKPIMENANIRVNYIGSVIVFK